MRKTFLLLAITLILSGFSAAQTQNCEVVEAQDAEASIDGENETVEQEMILGLDTEVTTGSEGGILVMCDDSLYEVGPDSEGAIEDVGESEDLQPEEPIEDVDVEENLEETDRIEDNLDQVNAAMKEMVPSTLRSLVLGDRVNYQVGDTTIGIESNDTEITGVEEGGLGDPTLEITMDSGTIENIAESEDPMEATQDAYDNDEIEIEAHSWRNKMVFGAADFAYSAQKAVSSVIG